ncbi:ABC transporter permease [Pseudoflavonifractor sp. 524-17]|uniref:ABC transporter permease n=1 Tax=Pseudoflavonifractor sp. 524-17 TaxID=2304577 RepID=UPI00325B6D2F
MGGWIPWIGKKLLRGTLLLLGVSVVTFTLMTCSPLDPVQANVGQAALGSMSGEQLDRLEAHWGKNTPPVQRYLSWLSDFVRGDMGISLRYRQPVRQVMGQRLANSLWLLAAAWVLSGLLGGALGVIAGACRGRLPDRLIRGICLALSSTPGFWLGLLLVLIFGVWLRVLPVGFSAPIGAESAGITLLQRLRHGILPAAALSLTGAADIALHTREKMADVMESYFIRFALARGASIPAAVLRHGLRNVALPGLTLQFACLGELLGGSVLVEQVFSYPGMGQAAVAAGLGSDLPLLMAITVVSAALVFGGNLTADVLCGLVDPRIRRGGILP